MIKKIIFFVCFSFISMFAFSQTEIKVISYNIRLDVKSDGENWWENRKDKVAGLINYYEADFIGLQEVLHNQLTYLKEQLNGYNYIGVGRDDGKQAGEYSCIFYNKEKYTLIKQSTFWLSPAPDTPSKGWDAALNRVCSYGLFKDKNTGKFLWIFNTHFDHIGRIARLESAKLINQKIKELNTGNHPVIITGDFNSRPEEEPVQYMQSQLQNSRSISQLVYGPADTWNGFKFNQRPEGCIDYIFVSHYKYLSVSKFATLTDSYDMKYPSDHFPVLATITIDK
jgi:endonuclease/exonuclease/phosphatase family metal-dependent hydrolase